MAERTPGIRPRATLGRRLDLAARHGFPAALTVLLMLLTKFHLNLSGQAALLAAVTFGSVWFWSVHRPAALPPPLVFGLGVLMDLLGSMPLGVGVLAALVVHGTAVRLRRWLGQHGHVMAWLVYAAVAIVASGLMWLLAALLLLRLLPPWPLLFQTALSIALYPLLAIPLLHAHGSAADTERA
jgi:rod shape-determining protein MreD